MRDEIAVHNKEVALKIIDLLVDQDYVVMLSREEDLYIINYLYSQYSDRNDVIFMDREEFDTKYFEMTAEVITDEEE